MADNAQKQELEEEGAPQADVSDEKQDKAPARAAQTNEVVFDKDIILHPQDSLRQYDKGKVKAFRASGQNKIATDLIAFMCDKSMTPRRTTSIKYGKIVNTSLLKFVTSGKVYWPPEKCEKYFFIFENTLGEPILKNNEDYPSEKWKTEDVMVNVAYPMINVLTNLRDKDVVHGQIWPGNIFYNGAVGAEKITLGECLTSPASSQLPALYEPIERALSSPEGRGAGGFADDIYSFGVSLAVILRGYNPMEGVSDEKIIEHKIEKGSYLTLLGKERLSGGMLELLRGLLYDDPDQRWTLEDLEAWLDGRRLTPKQSQKRVNATRPIVVAERKYTRPEILAKDAHKHVDEMARIIESGELEQWIDRAIEDKLIKVRMEQVMKEASNYERSEGYNARLCAAISVALYTECPIYYRGLSFIPSGFGKMLSSAFVQKKNMQDYTDVLKYAFVMPSIRMRKNTGATSQLARFDSARAFINQTKLNSGLERCIYFLDPEAPCLSPILNDFYVLTPEQLLPALNSICESSNPQVLFDRHIVAFLSVKDRRNIDPYLIDLASSEPYKRVLGQVRTLATIQKRGNLGKFPALTEWMSNNLEEVYARFHDAKKRDSIQKYIHKLKKNGDLAQVAFLFDDPRLFQEDVGGFFKAMEQYKLLNAEKEIIQHRLKSRKNFGHRSGQQVASVISMFIAFAIIIISAYIMIFSK